MINCIHSIHNHAPFKEGSEKGKNISVAKRIIIGLIVSAALAVGTYYLQMSLNVHQGVAITASVSSGILALVGAAPWVLLPVDKSAREEQTLRNELSDVTSNGLDPDRSS